MLNIFVLILIILPVATIIGSIGLELLTKNFLITTAIICIIYLALTFLVFNSSFLIWLIVHTALALLISFVVQKYFL